MAMDHAGKCVCGHDVCGRVSRIQFLRAVLRELLDGVRDAGGIFRSDVVGVHGEPDFAGWRGGRSSIVGDAKKRDGRMKECRGGEGRRSLRGTGRVFAILAIVGGLLLAAAGELRAQVAEPSYAGFEGQNVSKGELSAQPSMELGAFRSLVTQKEGAPFSGAAIRDSATALQRTALFSQVQVQITPEATGLRVVFILQPAAYIGMLRFPGATKVFLYTRLV